MKTAMTDLGVSDLGLQAWLAMGDPSLVFDGEGTVLACNRSMEALLGLPPDSGQGRRLSDVLGDPNGLETSTRWLLDNLAQHGRAGAFEISLRTPDGAQVTLEGEARSLEPMSGSVHVLAWRDVSERARRESSMRRQLDELESRDRAQTGELARKVEALARANGELQELDRTRAELISLVSHQIRAPLTNMLGALERMHDACPRPTSVCGRMFQVLQDQTTRLSRLVRDVLNLTYLESGELAVQLEPISVMPVLEQAVEQIQARGQRCIRLPYAPIVPLVMADRDHLTEVLVNLLDNADKYSPSAAGIDVDLRATETEVVISVLDSGPGLPSDQLERIFDKYYRAEAGDSQRAYGYGLGLYVCRRLVEAQGGRIWASNRSNGGAQLSVSLMVAAE